MRYASLDGLRAIAAYTVVISHFSNRTKIYGGVLGEGAGQLGVMVFFTLSGFLMARLYLAETPTAANIGEFARRRVARVVPLYLVVVILAFLLTLLVGSSFPFVKIDTANLLAHLLFWQGASVLWTVPVEMQFYLAFPLIWLLHARLGRRVVVLLGLVIAALLLLPDLEFPVLLRYAPFFMAGVIASFVPRLSQTLAGDLAFLACCVCYVLLFPRIAIQFGIAPADMWSSLIYLIFVPVFLLAALNSPLAGRLLGGSAGHFLGAISYSVYLLHLPVLVVASRLGWLDAANIVSLVVYLGAVTLVSWASFETIERGGKKLVGSLLRPVRRSIPRPAE